MRAHERDQLGRYPSRIEAGAWALASLADLYTCRAGTASRRRHRPTHPRQVRQLRHETTGQRQLPRRRAEIPPGPMLKSHKRQPHANASSAGQDRSLSASAAIERASTMASDARRFQRSATKLRARPKVSLDPTQAKEEKELASCHHAYTPMSRRYLEAHARTGIVYACVCRGICAALFAFFCCVCPAP